MRPKSSKNKSITRRIGTKWFLMAVKKTHTGKICDVPSKSRIKSEGAKKCPNDWEHWPLFQTTQGRFLEPI